MLMLVTFFLDANHHIYENKKLLLSDFTSFYQAYKNATASDKEGNFLEATHLRRRLPLESPQALVNDLFKHDLQGVHQILCFLKILKYIPDSGLSRFCSSCLNQQNGRQNTSAAAKLAEFRKNILREKNTLFNEHRVSNQMRNIACHIYFHIYQSSIILYA